MTTAAPLLGESTAMTDLAGITFPETIDTRARMLKRYRDTITILVRDATRRVGEPFDDEVAAPEGEDEQAEAVEAPAIEPCVGANHQPGCEHFAPEPDAPELTAWANVPVVTIRDLEALLDTVFSLPIPAPDEHVVEVAAPATVILWGTCPNKACGVDLPELSLSELDAELTIHANGTGEIKAKGKTKARSHRCGQLTLRSIAGGTAPDGQLELPLEDEGVPTCRVCGCTDMAACDGGCSWVEDPDGGDLCSACLTQLDEPGEDDIADMEGMAEPHPEDKGNGADEEDDDLLPGEPVITSMAPSVGETVVFDGDLLRIKSIGPNGELHAKASFGKVSASLRIDELDWDDAQGVWRVREG